MQTLRIAWRNLQRNRRRTAITVTAIALTTAILIATFALMEGMFEQMIRTATRLLVGDVQVHAQGYTTDRSFYTSIDNPDEVMAKAEELGYTAAPRAYGFGLVSSGNKSAGASYVGIIPSRERTAFELADEVMEGSFVTDEGQKRVVIGRKLAKSLDAKVGTELVAVVQAADGSLGNELLVVGGIFKLVGENIDRGAVFMHRDDFEELFVAGGRVHEIAINANGEDSDAVVASLASVANGADVRSWRQLMPMIADMVNLSGVAIYLFAIIFFLAAGIGVLNTMLMATHDRVRELGVLKALGATPWRIIKDITAEAFVLALVSSAIGTIVGVALALYFSTVGIDLSSVANGGNFSFSGISWDPLWRGTLLVEHVVVAVLTMWVGCVVASLYPAIKAATLDPARAMTHV